MPPRKDKRHRVVCFKIKGYDYKSYRCGVTDDISQFNQSERFVPREPNTLISAGVATVTAHYQIFRDPSEAEYE